MGNHIVRINKAPQPNLTDPLAQVNWIFFQAEAESSEISALGFRHAKVTYIRFLAETNAYYDELSTNPRFYLDKYWESDALIRFNHWLNCQNLTSKTRYAVYKRVRQIMDMAYALRVIDKIVYHAPMFKGVPETQQRAAYNKREQEVINTAIAKWISLAISVIKGYSPTGQGIPCRQTNRINFICIDGKTISTIDAAIIYGIPRAKIQERLKLGWTDRQAVGIDPRKTPGAIPVKIRGRIYASIKQAAAAFSVSESLLRSRLNKGWTPEQAVGLSHKKITGLGKAQVIVVEGTKYNSIKEAAQAYGLVYSHVNTRLHAGWSVKQALELEPRDASQGYPLAVEGITYRSISKAAEAYGLNRKTITYRLKNGATPEQAVGLIPMRVSRKDERCLLWLFEDVYKCNPHAMYMEFRDNNLRLNYGVSLTRLRELFAKWGVWPYVDAMLIMPLAVELAMLTGLNVESLKSLELDSYTPEHPLTGQPAIRYHKPRSGSSHRSEDRELHLQFLEIEELYIEDSVSEKIHTVIDMVKNLTSRIRSDAPPEITNRLFIFEDVEKSTLTGHRVIVPIEPAGKSSSWRNKFAREEGLRSIFGDRFNFNISRCRPTLATNMVLAGADLFQVQIALGHKCVQTTATYLDGLQLQPVFNKTISEALQKITRRSREAQIIIIQPLPNHHNETDDSSNFHETLSGCGCKNAYSPSENVKKATNYKEGSICKYWNMCLLCDNSIITQSSLPKLISYSSKLSHALTEASPAIKSRTKLFEDTVTLINGILEPGNIFPSEIIEDARTIAATQDDLLIDQLVYQGI